MACLLSREETVLTLYSIPVVPLVIYVWGAFPLLLNSFRFQNTRVEHKNLKWPDALTGKVNKPRGENLSHRIAETRAGTNVLKFSKGPQ